jgi:RNA polymerase sigma-B factor
VAAGPALPPLSRCTHVRSPGVRPEPFRTPLMTGDPSRPSARADEDRALFRRYHSERDPLTRDMIVERFLPLARRLARRYQRPDEPFDDLMQVAALGLVKAVDRYDPERPVAFSSFAVPTILGELRRHFRDRTWAVHVPRDLQELALKVEKAVGEHTSRTGVQPSVGQLAQQLGVSEEMVLEALEAGGAYRATSLQAPRGDGDDPGATLADTLGGEEDGFVDAEHRATLDRLLKLVSERDREVLRLRFEEDLTQAEIGERIGVSQMQVSRILRAALARLRDGARP